MPPRRLPRNTYIPGFSVVTVVHPEPSSATCAVTGGTVSTVPPWAPGPCRAAVRNFDHRTRTAIVHLQGIRMVIDLLPGSTTEPGGATMGVGESTRNSCQ